MVRTITKITGLLLALIAVYFFTSYLNEINRLFSEHRQTAKKNQIFCMILTKPDNLRTKALVTLYVWVSKCSDYRYDSVTPEYIAQPENKTFAENSIFKLLHPKGLIRENYTELTKKVLYAFRDVYEQVNAHD
jgi:hypothetical protein